MSEVGTLAEALGSLGSEFGVGFVQSPRRDCFVRRSGATLSSPGAAVDLDWVYDLRLWDAGAEFHWWWDQASAVGRWRVRRDDPEETSSTMEGQRLVRGSVQRVEQGWSLLSDGHSRPLWVPIDASPGARVAVGVREYLHTDAHGNVSVASERLTGLTILEEAR